MFASPPVVFFAVFIALLRIAGGIAAADDPTPSAIAAHAQAAWAARPRPSVITYDVTLRGRHKRDEYARRLHVRYRPSDRSTDVVLLESSGHPPVGTNPDKQRIFPDSSFGFVAAPAAQTLPGDEAMAVIGHVTAVTPLPYDVSLIDRPMIDGTVVDHLALRPRFDPDRFRVREMWVDPLTYRVHQLAVRVPEAFGPVAAHFVVVAHYAEFGPYLLIDRVTAVGAIRLALFSYSGDGEAEFANYAFPERDAAPAP